MNKLDKWIKAKLSEGFSKEQIKKALSDEGFDPTLVDLVLQNNKKTISALKNRLIILAILLSSLVVFSIVILSTLEHLPLLSAENSEPETDVIFTNQSDFNLFYDKGFFVSTDRIPFRIVDGALLYTNLSNQSLDIIILKISKYEEPLTEVVEFIDESINSSYASKFLRKSEELTYKNRQAFVQEYVILERNYRKIIKNLFIDFENRTLLISYKCNELDEPKCDELFIEATDHVSLV